MKTKHIALLCIATLGVGKLSSQAPIRREVDVTRAYEPSVQNALKINTMPDMTDTVLVRPQELRYQIMPRPLAYGFGVAPLAPVRFAALDRLVPQPFYLKLGAGAPLRSVGEMRYSHASERADFNAFVTHSGRYDKIENDMQIDESAFGTDNQAGFSFDLRPAESFSINAEAGYRFRHVTRYGYFGQAFEMPYYDLSDKALRQFFHNPHARVSLGSDPRSPRSVNARVGGGIDYVADRYRYDQMRWELDALIGFRTGSHSLLTLGVDAGITRGENNLKGYKNRIVRGEAAYTYDFDGLRARLGLGFGGSETTFAEGDVAEKYVFLPQLLLEKELFEGRLTPFLELRSEIEDNSFGELIKRNPYVFSGVSAPNTTAYRSRFGAKGVLGNVLKYKAYLGYDRLNNYLYWVNVQEYSAFGNAFTARVEPLLQLLHVGAEVQANLLNMFTLHAAIRGTTVVNREMAEGGPRPGGLPELTVEGGLVYNYRNRLYLSAEAELIGERDVFQSCYGSPSFRRLPRQIDLRFAAEYWANTRLGFFVQASNLLDQELYVFNHYREPGIGALAGVKISF